MHAEKNNDRRMDEASKRRLAFPLLMVNMQSEAEFEQ